MNLSPRLSLHHRVDDALFPSLALLLRPDFSLLIKTPTLGRGFTLIQCDLISA